MSGNKNGEWKGAGGTLVWLCTKEWVPTREVQMVRARLNWDPKAPHWRTLKKRKKAGRRPQRPCLAGTEGEEQLPFLEARQLTTVRDAYCDADDILLTSESRFYF